jgi:hypothetical protein
MLSFQTKLSHYRTATAVDLGEYKWYQKRAGLAGFFEFIGITFFVRAPFWIQGNK